MRGIEPGGSLTVTGRLIVASPSLVDPNFARTIVVVCEHDDDGAIGVVLNRATSEPVDAHLPHLADHVTSPPVVFVGGPVQPEVAVALAEGTDAPFLGGVGLADPEVEPAGRVRVFSGYAGWGPGQLDAELEEGAWAVVDADPDDVFHSQPDRLWEHVLRRQRGDVALWVTLPADPTLN
jgi:putative transcriptional regulator